MITDYGFLSREFKLLILDWLNLDLNQVYLKLADLLESVKSQNENSFDVVTLKINN